MLDFLKWIFGDFWRFIGFVMIIEIIFQIPYKLIRRYLRHLDISKNGWPPKHIDADGEFEKEED